MIEMSLNQIVRQPKFLEAYVQFQTQLGVYIQFEEELERQLIVFATLQELLQLGLNRAALIDEFYKRLFELEEAFLEKYVIISHSRQEYFDPETQQHVRFNRVERDRLSKKVQGQILAEMRHYRKYLTQEEPLEELSARVEDTVETLRERSGRVSDMKTVLVLECEENLIYPIEKNSGLLSEMAEACNQGFEAFLKQVALYKQPRRIALEINRRGGNGSSSVHQACFLGKSAMLSHLIALGGDVRLPTAEGYYPVHLLVRQDLENLVDLFNALYDADPASLAERDPLGNTALHSAAYFGNREAVKYLVDPRYAVVPLDAHAEGQTALYIAAARGYADIVKILLRAGADVNLPNILGEPPLFAAISAGHEEVMQAFQDAGRWFNADDHADPVVQALRNAISREKDLGRISYLSRFLRGDDIVRMEVEPVVYDPDQNDEEEFNISAASSSENAFLGQPG